MFFNDWLKSHCNKIGKKKITLDNTIYASFISEYVVPCLKKEFGPDACEKLVWEDDNDNKHRTSLVLDTVANFFTDRVPVEEQSSKMADIWPIENVWSLLRQKLWVKEFNSVKELKKNNSRMAKFHS